MKKIDWYISRKFLLTFAAAILLIIGIVIIFDISEKIDYFVKNEAPLKAIIVDYYHAAVEYVYSTFLSEEVLEETIYFTCDWSMVI